MGLPKAIPFLIGNEFCERFNYYGVRAVVSIYITEELGFSERESLMIYHLFAILVFTLPIFGGIIADSWWGKFKTIVRVAFVYVSGNIILALSATEPIKLPPMEFFFLGLLLIAVGTSGMKPCAAAFGGDQFDLPSQARELNTYFHLYYSAINGGSFVASFTTPLLRKRIRCFAKNSCYPIAFIIPGILLIIGVCFFVAGKSLYRIKPPEGNMVVKVSRCIGTAIKLKCKSMKSREKREHWLDYAIEEHGEVMVRDLKRVFKVLVLYIPIPLFWALFEQLATSWIFQARRLNGELGDWFTILPDQMQVVNPLFVLIMIPLFNHVVYPCFRKVGLLLTPLARMATGGILASVSYVIGGFLALGLEAEYPILPEVGNAQIRIFNVLSCDITINCERLNDGKPIKIPKLNFFTEINLPVKATEELNYDMTSSCSNAKGIFLIKETKASAYYFKDPNKVAVYMKDNVDKLMNGHSNVRTIVNLNGKLEKKLNVVFLNYKGRKILEYDSSNMYFREINFPGTYTIQLANSKAKYKFGSGGVYTVMAVAESADKFEVNVVVITNPNALHIFWMLPQYLVITAGEIMFSISGIEFAYSQAPRSMKSFMQACWLLTLAFGQIFVVLVEAMGIFVLPSSIFFLYASFMLLDMLVFICLSVRYDYVLRYF